MATVVNMASGTISVSKRAPQFWRDVLVIIVTIFLSPSIVVKFWGVLCTMFKITKSYKIIQIARTLKRPSLYYVSIFLDFSDHPPIISASIQNRTSAKKSHFLNPPNQSYCWRNKRMALIITYQNLVNFFIRIKSFF